MKVLHTSDWHLGRSLYSQNRHDEFGRFLDWLGRVIERERVDALLVSGDVFDSATPGARAQRLYYDFLGRIVRSSCRHVVITAGNHDSPSFLSASGQLLSSLDIHVVSSVTGNIDDEILPLRDKDGRPELLVCAAPYLRDRDIRVVESGETPADKERKIFEGVREHYASLGGRAEAIRAEILAEFGIEAPLAVMGHLFAAGGKTAGDDGVRDIYVGSLGLVPASVFPEGTDYLALGHLHQPQLVAGLEHFRYSGSPLQLGFGEAGQTKSVCLVDFAGRKPKIAALDVPVFRGLERVAGGLEVIESRLAELALTGEEVWVEAVHTGGEYVSGLFERLEAVTRDTPVKILRVKSFGAREGAALAAEEAQSLNDLSEHDVFERCLAAYEVDDGQKPLLRGLYGTILKELAEADGLDG